MAIRTTKIELFGFCGVGQSANKDRRNAWKELTVRIQQMQNRMWQMWLIHHTIKGADGKSSVEQIKEFYENYAVWAEQDRLCKQSKGKKKNPLQRPKLELKCCDKALSNSIYHELSREFPDVNARTRVLLQNKWNGTLSSRKATTGSKSGWHAILLAQESIPSFTSPLPIPFDKDNGSLFFDGKDFCVKFRIERLQLGKQANPSVEDTCKLMLRKRKANSQRQIIQRIVSGIYTFKGSSLYYNKRRNKWFALISYEMPDRNEVPLDASYVLHVLPAKNKSPWILMTVDSKQRKKAHRYGGNGRIVERARRMILDERSSRQEHNRWAGSAQKGRGRQRAIVPWTKLQSRWKDFTKSFNHRTTTKIVEKCLMERIGKVIYHQPSDSRRDEMLLAKIGNRPGRNTHWDWFQFGTLLSQKCKLNGIEYDAKKIQERSPSKSVSDVRKTNQPKSKKCITRV